MPKLDYNPFALILEVCNKMFPDFKDIDIEFVPSNVMEEIQEDAKINHPEIAEDDKKLGKDEVMFFAGVTMFDEPGGSKPPLIYINSAVPLEHIVEIIAHETAHLVAGVEAEHGEAFIKVFDDIFKQYCEAFENKK